MPIRAVGKFTSPRPSSLGTTNRQSINPQRRLTNTHRHALTLLTANPHTGIQLQIITDHADAGHHFRTISNQGGATNGAGNLAVFNQVGLGGRKHEFARRDINLAAGKIDRIQALVDRLDDFLRVGFPGQHERIGHAGHRQVRK